MTVQVRSYVEKDFPTLVNLLNEANKGSYEFMPVTEEELRGRIKDGKSRILIAKDHGKIVGSITYNDGYWGEEIRWLVLLERLTQRFVENLLVREAEKLVHGQTVFTSVDSGSLKMGKWAERGYTPDGGLYQMVAKLDRIRPIPSVPEGIVLRSMKPGEEKRAVETVNGVFGWERLRLDFVEKGKVDSPPFNEEWVHLAEYQDRTLSVVVAWPAVKYNRYFRAKRGYLGPAATIPEYRSKKLATALTIRAMNLLYEKSMDTVVLHTSERNVPSVILLRDIGFKIGHLSKFLRKSIQQEG
jgi:ribosomal protein S18 acetylase RimI-like enzyme